MNKIIIFIAFCIVFSSCNSQIGPGYNFSLFDSTPNKNLAKAVKEEDISTLKTLLKKNIYDIDLGEPKFGNTLLMLAIGNCKLKSVKALLEAGANVNVRDNNKSAPIHEASRLYMHRDPNCCFETLKLLISYGADVNSPSQDSTGSSINCILPLSEASENFECSKLLIDNGANPNFEFKGSFPVWIRLLTNLREEQIFVLHYIIINKKIRVPLYILPPVNGKAFGIKTFLNSKSFPSDKDKLRARDEILSFLIKSGYPEQGI